MRLAAEWYGHSVYALGAIDGAVKFGMSSRVERRVIELGYRHGPLKVLAVAEVIDSEYEPPYLAHREAWLSGADARLAFRVERNIHRALEHWRRPGPSKEWFDCSPEVMGMVSRLSTVGRVTVADWPRRSDGKKRVRR